MTERKEVTASGFILQDADFPDHYVNMQHPCDYSPVSSPFVEYIPHFHGRHRRLIVRVCWQVNETQYVPMSFVCDTGAPMGLYLSEVSHAVLICYGRIKEDEIGNEYTYVEGAGKVSVELSPHGHAPANIMGLELLTKLGLRLLHNHAFSLINIHRFF